MARLLEGEERHGALQDRDSEVVLLVIDTLEYEIEPGRLIQVLKPLRAHRDPEVREAAQILIEELEDL